jgi:hypothetical protein
MGRFDLIIDTTSQNTVLVQLIATTFAPHDGVHFFVGRIRFDNQFGLGE